MRKHILLVLSFCFSYNLLIIAQENRWQLNLSGGITWTVGKQDAHNDHIEMSGKYISAVVRYGVNSDHSFFISRDIVWPMLRTIPNNTHGSLIRTFNINPIDFIFINKYAVRKEIVSEIQLDGKLTAISILNDICKLERIVFPSTDLPVFCEKYVLSNITDKPVSIEIPEINNLTATNPAEGVEGSYSLKVKSYNSGVVVLQPNESCSFYLSITGAKNGQDFSNTSIENELKKRNDFLTLLNTNLVLVTPDETLNRAFAFAKIRASESIYQTKGGPMHGPGGLSYYAAIWANDQAE